MFRKVPNISYAYKGAHDSLTCTRYNWGGGGGGGYRVHRPKFVGMGGFTQSYFHGTRPEKWSTGDHHHRPVKIVVEL